MKIKESIVIRLKRICKERKITCNQLAVSAGVTPSTVYSIMDPNRRDISVLTLKKLCDALNMSLSEFFDDDVFRDDKQEIE